MSSEETENRSHMDFRHNEYAFWCSFPRLFSSLYCSSHNSLTCYIGAYLKNSLTGMGMGMGTSRDERKREVGERKEDKGTGS